MNQLAQNTGFGQLLASPSPTPSPTPTPTPTPSPIPGSFISVPRPDIVKINDVGFLMGNLLAIILIVSAVLAFIYLILGGIQWITSGGDKSALEAARNKITSAIVGLIIVASAWAIMALVQTFLGISLFGGEVAIPQGFDIVATPTPTPNL